MCEDIPRRTVSSRSLLVFDFLPKAEGISAMVLACVCVCVCVCACVCDALACKHDISRSRSCLNFKLDM